MKLKEYLEEQLENRGSDRLKDWVIDYVLDMYDNEEEIKGFFEDLSKHGCQSGMVSSLIYYSDTTKAYDDYEDEIEELVYEMRESLGIDSRPAFIDSLNGSAESIHQEKNLLCWFAFEETARNIFEEWEEVQE